MVSYRICTQIISRRLLRTLGPITAALAFLVLPLQAWGVYNFTVSNNSFTTTPVGSSEAQFVHVTLNGSAMAIKSIVLQSAGAGTTNKEYTLVGAITGCSVDPTGATTNPGGTVCNIPVTYAPAYPGSLASPAFSRNATLVLTDGNSNTWTFALTGAATGPLPQLVPGTLARYAGAAFVGTVGNAPFPQDNGLGSTTGAYGGDGGPAVDARFNFSTTSQLQTQPMAYDSAGNLYVIDANNYIIRKIDNTAQHNVTTIAGKPNSGGYSGDSGPATSAQLAFPSAITLDAAGDIYFIDNTNTFDSGYVRIRRIDAVTGIITPVAGQNYSGTYDSTHGGGTCVQSSNVVNCGDGGLATYADLYGVSNMAFDQAGNIYLWGRGYAFIREITAVDGKINTIVTATQLNSTSGGYGGMTLAADGNLYIVVIDNTLNSGQSAAVIKQIKLSTNPVTITNVAGGTYQTNYCTFESAQGGFPAADLAIETSGQSGDLASDASGNIYFATQSLIQGCPYAGYPAVYRINPVTQTAYLVADGMDASLNGMAVEVAFNAFYGYDETPYTTIPDPAGNLYLMTYNQIAEITGLNSALYMPSGSNSLQDYSTSADQTVAYINVGNASDTIPSYDLTYETNFHVDGSFPAGSCMAGAALAPSGVCSLNIQFTPTQVGALSDMLGVQNPTVQTVSLTGNGTAYPRIGVSPPSLSFGSQAANTSATQYVTISNTGTATLTVNYLYSNGVNPSNFVVAAGGSNPCTISSNSISLPAGLSCTIQVTFTPTAATSYSAYLEGAANTTVSSSTLISLSQSKLIPFTGTGTSPQNAQTITFTQPTTPVTYSTGLTIPLNATGGGSGNPVIFSIDSNSTGTGSITGSTLNITSVGNFIIDANQAGSATYSAAAQVERTVVVNPAAQTISFTVPNAAIYNGVSLGYTLSATGGGSGNPITFTVDAGSTAGIAGIIGNKLTISGIGTVIVDANQAAGGNYAAATQVTQTMVVSLDTPAGIVITGGSAQTAYVGTAFAQPLSVKVLDTGGNGVWGVTVTFAVPMSGASAVLSSMTAVSDITGTASVSATANLIAGGPYYVSASLNGKDSVTFGLTNTVPTFTVTTLVDDATGNAANCNDTSTGAAPYGACSLRDAIVAAMTVGTATATPIVNFAPVQSTSTVPITLSAATPGTYDVTTGGTLPYTNAVGISIVGPGANLLTVSGGATKQIFNIYSGNLTVSGLTFANGYTAGSGGAFNASQGGLTINNCVFNNNSALSVGGAIEVGETSLTVTNSTFTGNRAANGGAIGYFNDIATITGSTFANNSAPNTGGAIFNYHAGTMTVSNSTFTGNSSGYGGAINNENYQGATALMLINDTISGNSDGGNGSTGINNSGVLMLGNNLIGDSVNNSGGTVTDNGGNVVVGSGTPVVTLTGLALAPLGNYGGLTQTMPPLPGDVAICSGVPANATTAGLTTDQRGNPRSTTAYGSTICVDAGAVQTAYLVSFTTNPSASQLSGVALAPVPMVQLYDYSAAAGADVPVNLRGAPITVQSYSGTMTPGPTTTVNTGSTGAAAFSGLKISTTTTLMNDYLIASAPVGPYSISVNSSYFNIITLTLSPAPGALPAATYGTSYSQQFTASGGVGSYTYTETGLPPGLSINSGTGLLSGIPASTSNSPYTIAVTVTDGAANIITQIYTLAVNQAASAVSLTSSANPVFVKNAITFTASVSLASHSQQPTSRNDTQPMGTLGTGSLASPTGTVTFMDGTTPLCSTVPLTSGTATCTVNSPSAPLSLGSHSITAVYNGDANFFGSSSNTLTQSVADFAITMQNASFTVIPGKAAVYTFTVIPVSPSTIFPAAIGFSASGLPTGATAVFAPTSAGPCSSSCSTSVTLTIQTVLGTTTAANTNTDTGNTLASRLAPFSLALLLLPFVGRLRKAGRRFGRMLPVLLLLLAGMAAMAGMSGCNSTIGFFGQAQQSYTVGVTGTSGTLSHTSNVTLTVE
jgi:CSLREA domain-containing protein